MCLKCHTCKSVCVCVCVSAVKDFNFVHQQLPSAVPTLLPRLPFLFLSSSSSSVEEFSIALQFSTISSSLSLSRSTYPTYPIFSELDFPFGSKENTQRHFPTMKNDIRVSSLSVSKNMSALDDSTTVCLFAPPNWHTVLAVFDILVLRTSAAVSRFPCPLHFPLCHSTYFV